MKNLNSALAGLALMIISVPVWSVPTWAAPFETEFDSPNSEVGIAAVTAESPAAPRPASVDLKAIVEFQAGSRYTPGNEVAITVNEGETSVLTVEYKREIFASDYFITGNPMVDRDGQAAWSLHVYRQDREGTREVGPPKVADIVLYPGRGISLLSRGQYRGMPRNLRVTLSY